MVDYAIISSKIFNYVNYSIVNDLVSHLSDHCSLSLALMLKHKKKVLRKTIRRDHAKGILVWDNNWKYELRRLLESRETKSRLNSALDNNNVDEMTELFTQNLNDVCKQAGLRFNNITRKHIGKPWFDEQYEIEKGNLRSLGWHTKLERR